MVSGIPYPPHLLSFYPALEPSTGYLIHQDFSHCWTPWILLVSYRLRDFLALVKEIPRSETVLFRGIRPLASNAGALALSRESFDDAEIKDAFEYWLAATTTEKHSGIRASRVMLSIYDGDCERAASMLRSLVREKLLDDFHVKTLEIALALPPAGRGA